MKYLITIGLLFLCIETFSQDIGPPSLAIGTGEVLYERGKLDAELIASIVATKKDELKKELANRLILKKLQGGSYTLWYYTKQSIDLLFKESNKDIIEKEMLRNAVELMTVIALTEYFLRVKTKDGLVKISEIEGAEEFLAISKRRIIDILQDDYWDPTKKKLKSAANRELLKEWLIRNDVCPPPLSLTHTPWEYKKFKKEITCYANVPVDGLEYVENRIERVSESGDFLIKPFLIFQLDKLGGISINKERILYGNILLDMMFEVCSESAYLQNLGLFQRKIDLPERKYIDNYKKVERLALEVDAFQEARGLFVDKLKKMEEHAVKLLRFINEFSYASKKIEVTAKEFRDGVKEVNIKRHKNEILSALKNIKPSDLCEGCDQSFIDDLIVLVNSDLEKDNKQQVNALYHLRERVFPKLIKSQENAKVKNLRLRTDYFAKEIEKSIKKGLIESYKDIENILPTQGEKFQKFEIFLKSIRVYASRMTDILNNFDEAESYEKAAKLIADIGNLNESTAVRSITNAVLNINDKYLRVNQEENKAEIDVEGAYLTLYTKYAKEISGVVTPYFSVGINYNIGSGSSQTDEASNEVGREVGFVSEKIGVKFKLRDWVKERNYENKSFKQRNIFKSRSPIVKDIYILTFGSGLLYQIEALSTDSNMSGPLFGVGGGISFFNDLDLNVGYAYLTNEEEGFLNISFDIKITEYLSELGKKRKEKKFFENNK